MIEFHEARISTKTSTNRTVRSAISTKVLVKKKRLRKQNSKVRSLHVTR